MKKIIIFSLALLFNMGAFAQIEEPTERQDNIDWKEDSTEIRTVSDIIMQLQQATNVNRNEQHFNEVWGRRSYRNLCINLPYHLDPKEDILTSMLDENDNKLFAPKYKSNWSFTFSSGRSYRLHKNPIANTVQFYMDYTPFDLTVSNYKMESDANGKAYNSKIMLPTNDEKQITPWNLEKYQADYGMMLGPSVTVAPFTSMEEAQALHFLKVNLYAHFGYRASLLYMPNDEKADVNYFDNKSNTPEYKKFETMSDNAKLEWGHGFYMSWGFSLTWKSIGFGYEHNSGNLKYKSIDSGTFGSDWYKFETSSNRLYLSFRIGK